MLQGARRIGRGARPRPGCRPCAVGRGWAPPALVTVKERRKKSANVSSERKKGDGAAHPESMLASPGYVIGVTRYVVKLTVFSAVAAGGTDAR